MNKAIYFTTAQDINSSVEDLKMWKVKPNLSNQNFHNKMIRSLALTHEVIVFSMRSINENHTLSVLKENIVVEDNITWVYPEVKASKLDKLLNDNKRLSLLDQYKFEKGDKIFVDVLNVRLLKLAKAFAKKNNLKIIGICTDNPTNISFVDKKYADQVMTLSDALDGYICLTDKLDELFNKNQAKATLVIDGVTEEIKTDNSVEIGKPFIFFGGSLMAKYGVRNLIHAYKSLNRDDIALVISGHHEEENFLSYIRAFDNVIYVGALNYKEVASFEQNAFFAVNPRPIDDKIDEYSYPSKVLEYLANGVLTVSTANPLLKEHYEDALIFVDSGEVEDLAKGLEEALNITEEEKKRRIKLGKSLVQANTSLANINQKIDSLFYAE